MEVNMTREELERKRGQYAEGNEGRKRQAIMEERGRGGGQDAGLV